MTDKKVTAHSSMRPISKILSRSEEAEACGHTAARRTILCTVEPQRG